MLVEFLKLGFQSGDMGPLGVHRFLQLLHFLHGELERCRVVQFMIKVVRFALAKVAFAVVAQSHVPDVMEWCLCPASVTVFGRHENSGRNLLLLPKKTYALFK
jgi:hypothetical protein